MRRNAILTFRRHEFSYENSGARARVTPEMQVRGKAKMSVRFPNESDAYRQSRDALLVTELALRDQLEDLAAKRRSLPPGGEIPRDFLFTALDGTPAPLSSLFGQHTTLALYSYMFAPEDDRPCPACTSLVDGWNGQLPQIRQRIAFAAVSSAKIEKLADLKKRRGWNNLPLYSAAGTDYQKLYHGVDETGTERTFLNIFTRDSDTIRHFWGSETERAEIEGHPRHIDTIWPLWGMLDFTPNGREDFFPDVFQDHQDGRSKP